MQKAVNTFLLKDNMVCLGMKLTGHGKGKWNGFGGKTESGEEAVGAAIRELFEECGVITKPQDLKLVAKIEYIEPMENWQAIIFVCHEWKGKPGESFEMIPKWFEIEEIPYHQMWSNDKLWLPKVLAGEIFRATFQHDENGNIQDCKFSQLK